MKSITVSGLAVLALVGLTACGSSGGRQSAPDRPAPTVRHDSMVRLPEPAPACRAGEQAPLGNDRLAYGAVVRHHAVAFRAPGRWSIASFGHLNENGAWTVLGVLGQVVDRNCSPEWYRVQLPLRQNGVVGYVRAAQVQLVVVRTRILVDLSARRLTLYRNGRPVMRVDAGVGAPGTPTPTGRFYVDQRLIPDDPAGPWGPGAIGLSAHSNVLRSSWIQGAPIAIHGTDEPASVGQAMSHGCIRLDNAVLRRVFAEASAGTPVIIRA